MTTNQDALTEAEWASFAYTTDKDQARAAVERILSARAAALRADIARDIRAAGFGIPQSNPGRTGYMRVVRVEDAAQIALGGTDE